MQVKVSQDGTAIHLQRTSDEVLLSITPEEAEQLIHRDGLPAALGCCNQAERARKKERLKQLEEEVRRLKNELGVF